MIWTPGVIDILRAHSTIYDRPLPVDDLGELQSALDRPNIHVFNHDQYPSVHEKAASVVDSLCRSTIANGYELAWVAVRLIYYRNLGMVCQYGDTQAIELIRQSQFMSRMDVQSLAKLLERGFTDAIRKTA